jgi:hypothetical protein
MASRQQQQYPLPVQLRLVRVLCLRPSLQQASGPHQQQEQQGGMQPGVCSRQAQQL